MLKWNIDADGIIYSSAGQKIGFFDVSGEVYDSSRIDALGFPYGALPNGLSDISGHTYNETQVRVGFVDSDGSIYNMGNLPIATVTAEGVVLSSNAVEVGSVNKAIHRTVTKEGWRAMWLRAASAAVLVLRIGPDVGTGLSPLTGA
jgi:hypothetical protein